MSAPLEILLSESQAGLDTILTLELSQIDSERLSLPSTLVVIKTSSLERARSMLESKNLIYHALILEMDVLNPNVLTPLCLLTHDFPDVPVIVITEVYSRDLFLELTRCGVQSTLIKRILHEDSIARAILLSIERNQRSQEIHEIVIKMKGDSSQ